MKRIVYILIAAITISSSLFSCSSDDSLPEISLTPADLHFSVEQSSISEHNVILKSDNPTVIPYWKFVDAKGNELGHSNKSNDEFAFPFAGKYNIYFTAYTRGGAVEADPIVVEVSKNDEDYFSNPNWNMLANGVDGKTWVLDMTEPVGWSGLDYPGLKGDNWNWFPDYAGNSWVMPNKNWGEIRFDLNGGYNVSVVQTAITGDEQTTKVGTYAFDMPNNKLSFNGGVEMLYGGDYYADVSNWTSVKVIELTATSLRLGVIRNQSRKGEGVAMIVFHYKPKP